MQLCLKVDLLFQTLQIEQEIFDNLITLLTIFAKSFSDDALEFSGCLRIDLRKRWWFALQNRGERVAWSFTRKRFLARDHLVDHGAEIKNVGARIDTLSARLLGRHVADGSDDDARSRSDLLSRRFCEQLRRRWFGQFC